MRNPLNPSPALVALAIFWRWARSERRRARRRARRHPRRSGNLHVETVVKGLGHPWGLTFLPDGLILTTERLARLRSVDSAGRVSKHWRGYRKC
jgi:glucose/arabinose dehydrogenase